MRWRERVEDRTIGLADGRTVGYADYGSAAATAVLWCHGGPGSRAEPAHLAPQAGQAGLRIIGIDRPGYGSSTPQPGRGRWPEGSATMSRPHTHAVWDAPDRAAAPAAAVAAHGENRSQMHGDGIAAVLAPS